MSKPTNEVNKLLQEQKENSEFQNQGFTNEDSLREAVLKNPKPINLVFEGGGAKGALFAGALKTLESQNFLSEVHNVAGSSAGGMTAFMVALGYTSDEVIRLIMNTDFKLLEDSSTISSTLNTVGKLTSGAAVAGAAVVSGGLSIPASLAASAVVSATIRSRSALGLGDAFSFYKESHVWQGVECINLAKNFLIDKGFNPDMTFADLHTLVKEKRSNNDNSLKDLFLTGTDIVKKETQIFSHIDTPNVKIVDAFRATMSFPFAFKPHPIDMGEQRGIVQFADGGMRMNYPMDIFDRRDKYGIQGQFFGENEPQLVRVAIGNNKPQKINPYTLGFKVDSKDECETLLFERKASAQPSTSFTDLVKALMINSDKGVGQFYPDRTIQGQDMNISTLNFGLSGLEKVALMLSGREASKNYIEKMQKLIQGIQSPDVPSEVPKLAQKILVVSEKVQHLRNTTSGKRTAQKIYNHWIEILTYENDPIWIQTIGEALLSELDSILSEYIASLSFGTTAQTYVDLKKYILNDLGKTPEQISLSWQRTLATAAQAVTGSLFVGIDWILSETLKREHPLVLKFRLALSSQDFKGALEILSQNPGNTDKVPLSPLFGLKEVVAYKNTYTVSSFPSELLALEKALLDNLNISSQEATAKEDFKNIVVTYSGLGDKDAIVKLINHPLMTVLILEEALANQKGKIGIGLRFDYELQKLLSNKKESLEAAGAATPALAMMFSAASQNLGDSSTALNIHIQDKQVENSPKSPKSGNSV